MYRNARTFVSMALNLRWWLLAPNGALGKLQNTLHLYNVQVPLRCRFA